MSRNPKYDKESLAGTRMGKLVAVAYDGLRDCGCYWIFHCDCGKDIIRMFSRVVQKSSDGHTPSCGCKNLETLKGQSGGKLKETKEELAEKDRDRRKKNFRFRYRNEPFYRARILQKCRARYRGCRDKILQYQRDRYRNDPVYRNNKKLIYRNRTAQESSLELLAIALQLGAI